MSMAKKEVISRIKELSLHCKSMMDQDDPEDIWRGDVEALETVIEKLEGEYTGNNAAKIILQIMEKEGVNQIMLAERMGCARQNVHQILNRGTVNMRYDSLCRIAEILGYEVILRKSEINLHFEK